MCRFNLILIKEKEAEEILICEGYVKVHDDLTGYMAFHKGHCDCGSFVGSLCEKKELGLGYFEVAENYKKDELDCLYQIKEFMNKPRYREKRQEFEKQKTKLLEEMDIFRNHINEYEFEQMEEIKKNYSGEEYNQKLDELYQKIGELQMEVENDPAYQTKQNKYYEFLEDKQLMNDSTYYFLSEEEEKEARGKSFPLKELIGEDFQFSEEVILEEDFFEENSSVIDKVIEEKENNTFQNEIEEYNSYYEVFAKLLERVDSFCFATIWSEPYELKQVNKVDIHSLEMGDLAFLEYDEMICVTR